MTDTTESASAPKKRSFFKRAAWQDAPKKEGQDIFSHSNEFKDIVAEQNKRIEEEKRKEEEAKQRRKAEHAGNKRRRISTENDEPNNTTNEASSGARATRTSSKARSRTPLSPAPSHPPPDSLAARYDSLTNATSSNGSAERKEAVVIDLGSDSDKDDSGYATKSFHDNSALDYTPGNNNLMQAIPVRTAVQAAGDDSDEDSKEVLDPTLAALRARARERAAQRSQSSLTLGAKGEVTKAPVAQLLIAPEIPDASPLLVKVRIDSTIGKARTAWCGIQKYSPEMTKNVFFTWKGTRLYDSTTIKRLGIQVDKNGNVSVEGDSNLYDDVNVPKVVVEAWTEQLFQQRKKEDAAEAAARRKAAEPSPEVEEREPTPEPVPQITRVRLILKAKGRDDVRLVVHRDTTFAHIANAYKVKLEIDKHQPVTLMFDGERLMPLDTVADSEIEDLDAIEILFK